jgi:hypothetical protein
VPEVVVLGNVPVALPPCNPHGGVKGKRKSKKDNLREAAVRDSLTGKREG